MRNVQYKVISQSNIGWAARSRLPRSNFVFKITMLTVLRPFAVKTDWSYVQLFCHNTLALQTDREAEQTTDRQTDDIQTTSYDYSRTLQCNCNVLPKTWQNSQNFLKIILVILRTFTKTSPRGSVVNSGYSNRALWAFWLMWILRAATITCDLNIH